jgi:hypothetical protein
MRRTALMAVPLLLGLSVASCADPGDVTQGSLVGTWEADAFVFSDLGDPVTEVDVIGLGGSVTIAFDANGTYQLTRTVVQPAVESGGWELIGTHQLNLTATGATAPTEFRAFIYTVYAGPVLGLSSDDVRFDFGDGEIPAYLSALFYVK